MKRVLVWILVISWIFLPSCTLLRSSHTEKLFPDEEKRSAIVEAHGYAYLSESKPMMSLRLEAYADAKRQAAENAQIHIQSLTQVESFTLAYDIVQTRAEALVRVLEERDFGIEDEKRYHIWIKAEVQYRLRTSSEGVLMSHPQAPLTVQVWTDQKRYQQGEEMKIYLQGNKPFYAKVIYLDASGKIVQVLPNAYRTQNLFEGGTIYSIPGHGDHFKLDVKPPFGLEKVKVFASTHPLGEVGMAESACGLLRFEGTEEALETKVRGIAITPTKPGEPSAGKAEFYEALWQVQTEKGD